MKNIAKAALMVAGSLLISSPANSQYVNDPSTDWMCGMSGEGAEIMRATANKSCYGNNGVSGTDRRSLEQWQNLQPVRSSGVVQYDCAVTVRNPYNGSIWSGRTVNTNPNEALISALRKALRVCGTNSCEVVYSSSTCTSY